MEKEMSQATFYMNPYDTIECQYGKISRKEWLNREVARITSKRGRKAEIRELFDKIALFVDHDRK